ncbi:putative mediator of RNA polymerase II transcription subunit 24 [Vespula squamosa]|uniref:Mediator of RNA polymerase II transcription subunit 24 n=1 Tax=Vespula squamosa TaxID=30214 RepID=A0ABD2C5H9_VESSQ
MFESEDWNLDEEFLQDVDDKALKFFSHLKNEEIELPVKKRKLNIYDNTIISPNKIGNEQQSITNNNNEGFNKVDIGYTSRQNFVLGLFQQTSEKRDDFKNKCENEKLYSRIKSCMENISQENTIFQGLNGSKLENDLNIQKSRKSIVLDILKKKNVENLSDNNKISANKLTPIHSQSQKIINSEKSKVGYNNSLQKSNSCPLTSYRLTFFHKNETFTNNIVSDIKNCNQKSIISEDHDKRQKKMIQKASKSLQHPISKNINDNMQDISTDSNKYLLTQHLKESTSFNEGLDNIKHSSFIFKMEKQSNKKTTLIRKFPGPAGLLPDVIDTSKLSSYLKNLEDSKVEGIQDQKDTNVTEYCSQNTKTLFSEGAWQIMLDDLPTEFLKNFEIEQIKQIASKNQHQCIKIPFLAGIIENIDYSHENPSIVLKDFTDKIEGTIHADIPAKYPGTLEKNVVILLQNVGLLCISGTFIIHKYHILISPSNLLAIYSHTGDIIHTQHMEFLKKEFCMIESKTSNLNRLQDDNYNIKKRNLDSSYIPQKEDSSTSKKNHSKTYENFNQSNNSDIDSNLFLFSMDLDGVNNSQNQKNCNKSKLSTNLFEKEKNINLKDGIIMKENKENIHNNETTFLQVSTDTSLKYLQNRDINCSDKKENNNKNQNVLIKSRLSIFKCRDLTPVESISGHENLHTKTILQNNNNKSDKQTLSVDRNWAENILHDNGNDSDDEMLSQLDVDYISSYYDQQS